METNVNEPPASPSPDPTLAGLLQAVPEYQEGADLDAFVHGLVAEAAKLDQRSRDALVHANIRRVRIGEAWRRSMPKKRADRESWMRARGEAIGVGLTRVKQMVRAATAIEQALQAVPADRLPIRVLDRRLEAIPRAVKAVLSGDDPDLRTSKKRAVPETSEARQEMFVTRVNAAIRAIYADHTEELPAVLEAISDEIKKSLTDAKQLWHELESADPAEG